MKKKATTKKITTIVVFVLIIATLCRCCSLAGFGGDSVQSDTIDTTNMNPSEIMDLYRDLVEELNQEYLEMDKAIAEQTDDAIDLSGESKKVIDELNNEIARYFEEVYEIDVTGRLAKLNVKLINPPQDLDIIIYGYYNNIQFDNNVYISSAIVDDETLFEYTYVHETMHYLGFSSKNSIELTYVYEGLTEAITENIHEYSKAFDYVDDPIYFESKLAAKEILKATPEIVAEIILAEGEYDLEANINATTCQEDAAALLENSLKIILNGYGDESIDSVWREIVDEYANSLTSVAEND